MRKYKELKLKKQTKNEENEPMVFSCNVALKNSTKIFIILRFCKKLGGYLYFHADVDAAVDYVM